MLSTNSKIVFINGNSTHHTGVCDILRFWGFEVQVLKSVEEFPNLDSIENLNLILFHFNDFSEREFNDFHRLQSQFQKIPKIVTASAMSTKNVFRIGRAGADDYVVYPITPEKLWDLLRNTSSIRKWNLHRFSAF